MIIIKKQLFKAEKILGISTGIIIFLLWFFITKFKLISELMVPSPQKVLFCFLDILKNGYKGNALLVHLLSSIQRLFYSILLSIALAIPLGLLSGYNSKVKSIIDPIVAFYRPLPPLSYYTLLVLWMGIGNGSKIALLFLAGFAPMYISCLAGVARVKDDYINGAKTLGANKRQIFFYVVFPATLPDIFTGLRTSIGSVYSTLVAAEMVAAVSGIGWMVLDASKYLRSDVIFVGIIIMGIMGVLLDKAIEVSEKKVVFWKGHN